MTQDLPFARRLLPLILAIAGILPAGGSMAGDIEESKDSKNVAQSVLDTLVPLNNFEVESSYVGESRFNIKRFDGAGAGRAIDYRDSYEENTSLSATRRIHLFDKVYLKLGVQYERFDFGTTTAPIPSTLQSLNGVVALEYVVHGKTAMFIHVKPGVYVSHFDEVNLGSVDVPVDVGSLFPTPLHNVYALIGARYSALAKYPFFPILGVVWLISDNLRLVATPPEPHLVYKVNDHLDLYVGGGVLGDSYKTSYRDDLRPQERRFNGAVLDYSETRVGGGLTYGVGKALSIDLAGGCSLERSFDYYRPDASKKFVARPAPYVKLAVSAEF